MDDLKVCMWPIDRPITTRFLHARNLYDLTLSAPKSVSMMAILTGDKRLIDAHDRAVAQTLAEIEKQAATRVRAKDQNEDRITARDWNTLAQVRENADIHKREPKTITAEQALQHGLDHRV